MHFSAIRSILKCELDGRRYLRRSALMATDDLVNSLSDFCRILSLGGGFRFGSQS
jgi:hypothetical protein